MQEHTRNNIREAIDGMEELPEGISFNSRSVWAQLEPRMPRRKNKRILFYYAAAAVLAVACTTWLLWPGTRSTHTPAYDQQPGLVRVPKGVPGPSVTARMATPPSVVARKEVIPVKQPPQDLQKATQMPEVQSVVILPAKDQTQGPVDDKSFGPPALSPGITENKTNPVLITTRKPLKRNYRIIHLNDLDAPPPVTVQGNVWSRSEFRKMLQQQEEKETEQAPENNTRPYPWLKKPITTSTISLQENN